MLKALVQYDIAERLGTALEAKAWYIDAKTGRYSCQGRVFHDKDRPWIYVNPVIGAPCPVYMAIVSECSFIPRPCLYCWKVVVVPNSLYELMQLYEFQKEFTKDRMGTGHFCKCGIEERKYVPHDYGGYFYCTSMEHGQHRYEQIRAAMDEINPSIGVILKRYCTEFAIKLGPTDEYERPEGSDELEAAIFKAVDVDSLGKPELQPEWLRLHIIRCWIEFAWDRGDPTAISFNDGKPLYSPAVTYHKIKLLKED